MSSLQSIADEADRARRNSNDDAVRRLAEAVVSLCRRLAMLEAKLSPIAAAAPPIRKPAAKKTTSRSRVRVRKLDI